MAPTNRTNPQRARSSESQYSIMEFMRDFPDDAACLEWLWRTRFSEDGVHAQCPNCDDVRTFRKYETKQQRQSSFSTTQERSGKSQLEQTPSQAGSLPTISDPGATLRPCACTVLKRS